MPLYPSGLVLIKRKLLHIAATGQRGQKEIVGVLTPVQHQDINAFRLQHNLPVLASPEIIFYGKHCFDSRIKRDRYQIDDVLTQISHALRDTSVISMSHRMTVLQSTSGRHDRFGNTGVRDWAVFELMAHKPYAELLSVIPKGDAINPLSLGVA